MILELEPLIPNLKKKKHKKEKLRTYLLHRQSEVQIWEYLTLKVEVLLFALSPR